MHRHLSEWYECTVTCEALYPLLQVHDVHVPVGTQIEFVWQVTHGLFQKPDRSCPASLSSPGVTLLHKIAPGGTYTTPPLAAGTYFYACPVRSAASPAAGLRVCLRPRIMLFQCHAILRG